MHVIIVHYACDTPDTWSASMCDCPDLPGRSLAAIQVPTNQFNTHREAGGKVLLLKGTGTTSPVCIHQGREPYEALLSMSHFTWCDPSI